MTKGIKIYGEGKYAAAEFQQFVDKTGQLVRHIKGQYEPIPVGEAYSFFHCNASRKQIENTLPTVRELTLTPNELELYLYEGDRIFEKLKGDSKLNAMSEVIKEEGINYLLHSYSPTQTNKQTADELAAIMINLYGSGVFGDDNKFARAIVYKEKGDYIFRE